MEEELYDTQNYFFLYECTQSQNQGARLNIDNHCCGTIHLHLGF